MQENMAQDNSNYMVNGTNFLEKSRQELSQKQEAREENTPVNLWLTEHEVVIEAPMPGIKPENIDLEVQEDRLVINGKVAGSHGEGKNYLSQEWHLGPYKRVVELPFPVNYETANVNYADGVVVARLPKTTVARPGKIQLDRTGVARGQVQGHSGQHAQPAPAPNPF